MSLTTDRTVSTLVKAPERRKVALKGFAIVIFILLIILAIFMYINWERQKTRDAVRLSNVALMQGVMQEIFYEQGNYKIDEFCNVDEPLLTESCWEKMQNYFPNTIILTDPKGSVPCTVNNCESACLYSLIETNEDNYRILFSLERGIEDFEAGCHHLDRDGIH
jgi:hypothetical protein